MTDFNYSLAKDTTKGVPLYHHEQVPFHSISRQSMTPTTAAPVSSSPMISSNKQQQQEQTPASGDLQEIIYSYQSQPDLLRLILLSKLEEDKRRAEEAKLRAKELDLLLMQQQQQLIASSNNSDPLSFSSSAATASFQQSFNTSSFNMQPTPPISTNSSTDGRMNSFSNNHNNTVRRTSLDAILVSPTQCTPTNSLLQQQHHHRRDSTIGSSFTGSADSDEFDDRTFSPIPTSTPVSASSLLQMDSYNSAAAAVMSSLNNKHQPSYPNMDEDSFNIHHHLEKSQSVAARYDFPPRPRRRREMQAITKIVETREYPYIDGHFWKNNGNTVQKKTGNKSVYYKCSNSNKGCPVNKTVTWKDNGEYLIKYRGEHLPDCNKVQRIVDV
ncbi:hypothetical protein K501DRAFT_244952 [Backusella circina FSU 941]|nr:hypothetical protein K501DRAFT_244952 [Backusella circina FSU 941]